MQTDLSEVFKRFSIEGELLKIEPLRVGHIHRTYVSTWSTKCRFVHQLVNDVVFKNPIEVMSNIRLVTDHLRGKYEARKGKHRQALKIVKTKDGADLYRSPEDGWWRTYEYVENSRVFNVCQSNSQASLVGIEFGNFQRDLLDLPKGCLHDPIPGFMKCGGRFEAFVRALDKDPVNRAFGCSKEIEFILEHERYFSLIDGVDRKSPTHGDMKLNNILFSAQTGQPVCIVDLDTCMEGSYIFDFGDMARVVCASVGEEEGDLNLVSFRKDYYDALESGYLEEVGDILSKEERDLLQVSPMILSLTVGTRFLTDYLSGDRYFGVSFPANNLVRCRNQLQLTRAMKYWLSSSRSFE